MTEAEERWLEMLATPDETVSPAVLGFVLCGLSGFIVGIALMWVVR